MSDENFVSVTGNATRDPELRFTQSGHAVASFGLAINDRWMNKQTQEWEDDVSFVDVTVWHELAENVAESIQKGDRVNVRGKLKQDSWEKEGEKKSKIEIVASEVSPSLKWGTTEFAKREKGERQASARGGSSRGSSRGSAPAAAPQYDNEEPF